MALAKKAVYILSAVVVLVAVVALVLGLVLGLKNSSSKDKTDAQKFETCRELTCRNTSLIQELSSQCSLTSTARSSTTTTRPVVIKNYRLPTDLRPTNYNIMISTSFDSLTEPDTFDGYVNIRFKCVKRTNTIVLHKRNMNIDEAMIKVTSAGSMQINVSSTSYDEETNIYKINLVQTLQDGQDYSIAMHYGARFGEDDLGLYKSFYTDEQGRKRWLATSQMESVEARKAFPCFDEPGMKAQFKLTVVHHKSLKAMSNMPVDNTVQLQGDLMKTEFQETVPMSTYLVALVISDFECKGETLEGIGASGSVEVRVCGRAVAIASGQLDYSLKIAAKILKFYENFYGVKYPLPKCDHLAVPDSNKFSGMENWGLIIYRESSLFYDAKSSSQSAQQRTVVVIAHELAHMWFGNLVTTQWWNDLWLNEGFATYVEYVGTDAADATFQMFEQFVERVFDVLEIDAVPNSRAISVPEDKVNMPDDIDALFDSISYGKGGSVIRMMNYMMGESTFLKGIKNYLNKYKFSNAVQNDLWVELDTAAKEDNKLTNLNLPDVMNTWTQQMGHPLITIQKVDNNNIRISQEHFLLDTSSKPTEVSPFGYKWYVPFTYSVEKVDAGSNVGADVNIQNLYNRVEWLRQNENSKVIRLNTPLDGDNGFILANLDVSGFYRVNYDEANWDRIVQQLVNRKDAIPTRNRAQLINDAFGLSQAGIISTTRPFELIRYLSRETEYLPWSTTITRLSYYTSMLDSTSAFGNYEKYVLDLITPLYNRLGWVEKESDSWLDRRLRASVLSFACARDLGACVSKARSWYSQWMQNESENPIPGSYRSIVYCTAIRQGGEKEWEFASAQYDKEQSASQRVNLQGAMSCTKQPWLISRFLNDQLNSSKVRLQELNAGINSAAVKSYANLRTWTFVKDNYVYLSSKIGMGGIISNIASKFNTKAQQDDFERFFEKNPNLGDAERDVKTSIDTIKSNIRWMNSGYEQLSAWLTTYQNAVAEPTPSYRLATELSPYHYDVTVGFQFVTESNGGFPYDGEVTIHFRCVKDTSSLVLHINKMLLDNSTLSVKSLTDQAYNEIKAFNWYNDFQRNFFIANFSRPFRAGQNYTFSVKFIGYLTDDNAGFYRSSYVVNGVKKWLMTSQLESTSARKSFPCFDEPAFKATWKFSAIHQKDYNALSNMPVERIVDVGNNRVRTEFFTTPAMSSYLGALVVSDFVCKYENANAGLNAALPIGSCGRPNAVDQLDFGLDIGVRIMEYLERLFVVKFPLPKCDHIAIPDFAAGAMENWGLVTYRQTQYLYTPGVTVPSTEQAIAGTIVHEIVHMWFGDIVSPLWWDDTWLNEGFARYFQYIGASVVQPKYQMIEQFKNLFFNRLYTDSVGTARSVSFGVNTPSQISAMFDSTTYDKGGSILHMVSNFLGNETFVKGLVRYLDRYSYGNTDGEMLWNTIDEVVKEEGLKLQNMNLNELMNTWMKQMGHPVVTVKRVDDRTISLTQNHFLLDPTTPPIRESAYNYRWYIPYTHSIERIGSVNADTLGLNSNNLWQKTIWFTPNEDTKTIVFDRPLSDDEFVLANLRASGFYRVNYDNHFWDRIVKQLMRNKDAIPVENRAQFIHDSFAFSDALIIDGEKPFELIEYLSKENEELPWMAFNSRIGYFYNMLVATSAYGNFQSFVSSLIRPWYLKLDWEEKPTDSWIEKLQRTNVVSISCLRGVPECVDKARSRFSAWMAEENNNTIPSAYRSFIYCTAIREGGENEWNFALARYKKETDATERNNLLNGMSCTTRTWLVSRFLNDQLSNPRASEGLAGLRAAAIRPDAILKTWNFVKENWNVLFTKYGTGLAGLLVDFSTTFNTQLLLDDFNSFFANNADQSTLASQITTAQNVITRNVEWYKKSFKRVNEWFSSKYDQRTPMIQEVAVSELVFEKQNVKQDQDEIITFLPKMEINLV